MRALRTPSVSGPLAPRSRIAATTCRTSRPRVLCAFPFFPDILSSLDPMALSPYWTPLPLSFSSLGNTAAHMPPMSSKPPLLYFPLRSLTQGAHHGQLYPHSVNRQCLPSMSSPLSVHCTPPPFATIRCPWSLLFFFVPIPLNPKQSYEIQSSFMGLGSSVRGDCVIQEEERI